MMLVVAAPTKEASGTRLKIVGKVRNARVPNNCNAEQKQANVHIVENTGSPAGLTGNPQHAMWHQRFQPSHDKTTRKVGREGSVCVLSVSLFVYLCVYLNSLCLCQQPRIRNRRGMHTLAKEARCEYFHVLSQQDEGTSKDTLWLCSPN
jgi:hypothetical protein